MANFARAAPGGAAARLAAGFAFKQEWAMARLLPDVRGHRPRGDSVKHLFENHDLATEHRLRIFFSELDCSRPRKVLIQVSGE